MLIKERVCPTQFEADLKVRTTDSLALKTPAGAFTNVLRTIEMTPLEPTVRDSKYYARGIGLLRDCPFLLVRHGMKM